MPVCWLSDGDWRLGRDTLEQEATQSISTGQIAASLSGGDLGFVVGKGGGAIVAALFGAGRSATAREENHERHERSGERDERESERHTRRGRWVGAMGAGA